MTFSVVIPFHNAAATMSDCLQSVFAAAQALGRPVEIVCVDDRSTDGGRTLAEKLFEEVHPQDARLVMLETARSGSSGVSAARNMGMEAATGEFLCFVDADDTVATNWLMVYEAAFRSSGADVVRIGGGPSDWLSEGYPWKYAVRREVALRARFPESVDLAEDGIFIARILPFVRKVAVIPEMTYCHRERSGSLCRRPRASAERLRFFECLRSLAETRPEYERRSYSGLVAFGLITWLDKPADLDCHCAIRREWLRLRQLGCARIDGARRVFRPAYAVYALTGWLWPLRFELIFTNWFVGSRQQRGEFQ